MDESNDAFKASLPPPKGSSTSIESSSSDMVKITMRPATGADDLPFPLLPPTFFCSHVRQPTVNSNLTRLQKIRKPMTCANSSKPISAERWHSCHESSTADDATTSQLTKGIANAPTN